MIGTILSAFLALASGGGDPAYLVVLGSDDKGFRLAAEKLAKAHGAALERWDGDWDALARLLAERRPRQLALVLPPSSIDANLPRRLAPLLARLDSDPFLDCAFGLITGASGSEAQRFVDDILRASRKDLPARFFAVTSVDLEQCMRVGPERTTRGVQRPLESNELWLTGQDVHWREFLERQRDLAEGSGLIEWGHSGDSQGIWLFSMFRNRDRSKHWPFDPAKVGQDPGHEMPRLLARDLTADLDLFPAVILGGACHSGVTCTTMVGGDIVSTFGDTGGVIRTFDIAPEQSFPLMAIRAGASAYIGALGPNNANRAAIEEWWVRRGGVSLGEVVKHTFDELVLGAREHALAFATYEPGRPEPAGTPMFEDCAHRVLFGDPAFLPWREAAPTSHALDVKEIEGGLRVELRWTELASDPWVWDPWREGNGEGGELGRL
jgi:hypothetical protein